jgi:hypothetical protein
MNVNIFVVSVMEQIRKGCEAAGCSIPVGVSFDIGLSACREGDGIFVTGSDGVRVKFSLPFLHNSVLSHPLATTKPDGTQS